MTLLTGIDLMEIARIERAVTSRGERFLRRVYSHDELERYRGKPHSLAARFAAKEAVMKILDNGNTWLRFRDIEVLSEPGGRPYIRLRGKAAVEAARLGIGQMSVSLSHSREYAVASVVAATD
ncbi:MAG: holo-ACP synthase [Chloroflexi bacterium]|nr:holo-ACP synthase [Chloroflexota bacterium]